MVWWVTFGEQEGGYGRQRIRQRDMRKWRYFLRQCMNFGVECKTIGLEWLQQLFDVVTEEGYVMRTHVYRVKDAEDAYTTLQRIDTRRADDKRLLLDLPTKECERLIEMEVRF